MKREKRVIFDASQSLMFAYIIIVYSYQSLSLEYGSASRLQDEVRTAAEISSIINITAHIIENVNSTQAAVPQLQQSSHPSSRVSAFP